MFDSAKLIKVLKPTESLTIEKIGDYIWVQQEAIAVRLNDYEYLTFKSKWNSKKKVTRIPEVDFSTFTNITLCATGGTHNNLKISWLIAQIASKYTKAEFTDFLYDAFGKLCRVVCADNLALITEDLYQVIESYGKDWLNAFINGDKTVCSIYDVNNELIALVGTYKEGVKEQKAIEKLQVFLGGYSK